MSTYQWLAFVYTPPGYPYTPLCQSIHPYIPPYLLTNLASHHCFPSLAFLLALYVRPFRLSPLLHPPPLPLTTTAAAAAAAAAMDPYLPPNEGTDSNYSSDSLLTPLHEVIMPTGNMQNSTLRAFPECLPLPPPLLSLPPPPPPLPLSTIGNSHMQSLMENYQQPVYPSTQDLVPNIRNPNYSFMSLLEGDERAVRQAELELVESMYSPPLNSTNPSFAPTSPLFPVSSLPLPTVHTNQNMAHLLGEATTNPQLRSQLSSGTNMAWSSNNQYYNSFNSFPVPDSANLHNSTSSSIIVHTTMNQPLSYPVPRSQEKNAAFTCRTCRVHFPTAQAYGGHMSSHSKTRKVPNVVPQTLFKKPRATLHFPFFSYERGKGVVINPSKNFDASKVAKNTTGGGVNSSQASKGKEPMSNQGDLAKENDDESERETQSPKKKA